MNCDVCHEEATDWCDKCCNEPVSREGMIPVVMWDYYGPQMEWGEEDVYYCVCADCCRCDTPKVTRESETGAPGEDREMSRRVSQAEWAARWDKVLAQRDMFRAALEEIATFEPDPEIRIRGPYEQIAAFTKNTARQALADADALGRSEK